MALDAAPDLNELSSELTGVLAHVLGGLHDRVQALEDKLAAESAAKEEAERALTKTAEELHEREAPVALPLILRLRVRVQRAVEVGLLRDGEI